MKLVKTKKLKNIFEKNKVLLESEGRYKTFIELSAEGIWRFEFENNETIDVSWSTEQQTNFFFDKGILAECNDAMARMYGYENHKQFNGVYLHEILLRSKQENIDHFCAFINSGYRLIDAETIEVDNKGNIKYFLNNLHGILKGGRLCGVWGIQRDITRLKKAEDALLSMNAELARKNEELIRINTDLDNFIFSVSHDLNAPLSNLAGIVNVLKLNDCYRQKDPKQMIDYMDVAIRKFKSTIKELAEVTKSQLIPSSDNDELLFSEVVEEVKFSIKNLINDTGAEISEDFSFCEKIRFKKHGLQSILYNLLSNAIKYHHPDRTPRILVSSSIKNEFVMLEVRDNGLGIPVDQVSQMFTLFKRFHSHVEGTGIGLYILKRIVENAGGKVEVESELDKGTCFRVYLKPL